MVVELKFEDPPKIPENVHNAYPTIKITEKIKHPFLTPNLSIKKPPNRGKIILGKEYMEYNHPYLNEASFTIFGSYLLSSISGK